MTLFATVDQGYRRLLWVGTQSHQIKRVEELQNAITRWATIPKDIANILESQAGHTNLSGSAQKITFGRLDYREHQE